MAEAQNPDPVLLVVAAFSRHLPALVWADERLHLALGPVALTSPTFIFDQTAYYEPTMGTGLQKQFLAFANLVDPGRLADFKILTNGLERELASTRAYVEPRPLNLDPGILSLGKFMLATTKDQAHRIYLREGIFAETTLRFHDGEFEPWPWTYADYREPHVLSFFKEARDLLRRLLRRAMSQ